MSGLMDVAQAASNAVASNVYGPVDLLAAALRKAGVPVPEDPFLGSEWLRKRGLIRDVPQGVEQVAGETLGLLAPAMLASKASQIASGLLKARENAAAPNVVNAGMRGGQRGALVAAEREEAMRVAQKNAAKPVSQGGLGLRPNNTPAERAAAMGFEDAYHGSNRVIDPAFDMSMLGENTGAASAQKAIFAAADPATPHAYIWASPQTQTDYSAALINKEAKKALSENPALPEFVARQQAIRKSIEQELEQRKVLQKVINSARPKWGQTASAEQKAALRAAQNNYNNHLAVNEFVSRSPVMADEAGDIVDAFGALGPNQFVPISKVSDPAPNIMPLMVRANDLPQVMTGRYRDVPYADAIEWATKHGAEGVVLKNTMDGGPLTDIFAITNPARFRSRFAAFDPAKISSDNLLAGVAAFGLGVPLLYEPTD